MKRCALIMAGGRGERFWPRSRKQLPKQFLSLTGDGKTMIQLTVERILPLVDMEDVYIATNKDYLPLVRKQLPLIPEENILCEPVGRNTAPCIALAAAMISAKYEDAVMMVLPSDHLIKFTEIFRNVLQDAVDIAEKEQNLVTIGITPDHPETGYGYIKFIGDRVDGKAFPVERFVEKPSLDKAKEYLASEEYLWNSGMFMWKISTILGRFKELMPDLYEGVLAIRDAYGVSREEGDAALLKRFPEFTSISIDYGVMEKSDHIYTLPGNFGWDDVGSWLAVERIKQVDEAGNIVDGNVIAIDTKDCIIQADQKLIAMIGLEDLVVVDTEDATLICKKGSTADIKKVLENLRNSNRNEYL